MTCTKKGRHTTDCKSKRRCFQCKGRHHTSIYQRDSYKTQLGGDKADTGGKDDTKKDIKINVIEDRAQNYSPG